MTTQPTEPTVTLLDHLVHAAEHVRQANHATYGSALTIPELYSVTGALVDAMTKLKQQLNYLYARVDEAHDQSERYYHDNGGDDDVEHALGIT
ncbi:MAG: hypothetical protein M3443_06215, partial [Actinomycetota bacterium]|nr:hypothetical protein [Actinomycetota bacterium]